MRFFVLNFILIITMGAPKAENISDTHTASSGELNLATLEQIENLICKKTGVDFKNYKSSFTLNNHHVYSKVDVSRFGPSVYEESFYDVSNPEKECKIRLVRYLNGDRELAVYIHGEEGVVNCHAAFDSQGNMLADDPWGLNEGYTIEIFKIYNKYENIYLQRVVAKEL